MTLVRAVVERIVALGIVDERAVAEKLDPGDLDRTLDYFGGVQDLLFELGIGYSIDYKTFRHACENDGAGYREELRYIAAATRGLLTITDVELVDDADGDHLLRFRTNGEPHEWPISHRPDEDFEASLQFTTSMDAFTPSGTPARWCSVELDEDLEFVFADPVALNRLGAEYGVTFEPQPAADD
jgi:hypothetical protein